jgi:hypothetical protein
MAIPKLIQKAFLKLHKTALKLGIQVTPNHYYSPVADINKLKNTKQIWAKKSELPGLNTTIQQQTLILEQTCLPYQKEYLGNSNYNYAVKNCFGPGFGYVEAQVYHSVIRAFKPKRIVEVGSGVSTYCALKASEMNLQKAEIICIEPYPSKELKRLDGITIIQKQVQEVSASFFEELRENDVLFIDSSHTVKPGGDVNYLVLEVLPRLHKGVIVHFHDVFLPYDYQRDLLSSFCQWNETALLHAYLIYNNHIEILFCLSMLHYDAPEVLHKVFPEYQPQVERDGLIDGVYGDFDVLIAHFPASMYLRVKDESIC